jgi:hypothetical protein
VRWIVGWVRKRCFIVIINILSFHRSGLLYWGDWVGKVSLLSSLSLGWKKRHGGLGSFVVDSSQRKPLIVEVGRER